MVEAMRRHLGLGLVAMLLSSAAFGTSGPFAKSLMTAGWSPGAVVLARITGAADPAAALRAVEPARPVARDPPRAAPGRALRHARRRRRPARLLPGRLPDGRRHRPAHRVPGHRARRAVGVGAHPPAAAPAHRGRHRAGPGRARPRPRRHRPVDPAALRRALGPGRGRRPGRPLRARRPPDRHPVDRLRRAGPDRRRRRPRRARPRRGAADGRRRLDRAGRRGRASRPGWPWPSWSSWPLPSPTCSASSAPACWGRRWRRSSASPRCSSPCCSPGCCSPSCPGVLQLVGGAVLLSGVVAVRLGERDLARTAGARDAAAETDLDVPSPVA